MGSAGRYGYRIDPSDTPGVERIDGLREVQRDLRKLGKDTRTEMKGTHQRAAEIVLAGAKRLVPVRTGNLAASMRAMATQTSGRIRVGKASVPYAGPIHFGWPARNIKPNPFVYDALDPRRDEIVGLYEERIDQLIKKYDLDIGGQVKQLRATQAAGGKRRRRQEAPKAIPDNRTPDAFIRDASGNITGGIFGDKVIRF
jgi:hypothetical protein